MKAAPQRTPTRTFVRVQGEIFGIALEIDHVARIEDVYESSGTVLDVHQLLGDIDTEPARSLRVRIGSEELSILTGPQVRLVDVEVDHVHPLPEWIGGLCRQPGVRAVIIEEDAVYYVLDPMVLGRMAKGAA